MTAASAGWTPPALTLVPAGVHRPTGLLKTVMEPERFWPSEMLDTPTVRLTVAGRSLHFISDAVLGGQVLRAPETDIVKSPIYERFLRRGLGSTGISVSVGEQSRRLRGLFAPRFRPDRADHVLPLVDAALAPVLARWRARPESDICLSRDMIEVTFGVVWSLMFGQTRTAPGWIADVASRLHDRQAEGDLAGCAEAVDAAARRTLEDASDGLFAASDTTLSPVEKFDNARQFLNAGYETSAPILTWCLWMLAQDDATTRAIQAELDTAGPGSWRSLDTLLALPWLSAVLDETMRLYPPGAVTLREARGDFRLGDQAVTRGDVLAVNLYGMHRRRDLWVEADAFRPTRFLAGKTTGFMPFSAGRHVCIGSVAGRVECLAVLAAILSKFDPVACDQDVAPRMLITLRPDRAVRLRVRRRV